MTLEGRRIRLRAVEPQDAEVLYAWENDPAVWAVSGTTEPFSREQIERFIDRQLQGGDLFRTGQLRLMIETRGAEEKASSGASEGACGETDGETDGEAGKETRGEACNGACREVDGEAGREAGREACNGADRETGGEACNGADGEPGERTCEEADGVTCKREAAPCRTIGTVDLFEYDPLHGRAGLGILIYDPRDRRLGYARDAVETLCEYARNRLRMHQLWCCIGEGNTASRMLFRELGFREVGTKRDWLWSPEGYQNEILLQKILD